MISEASSKYGESAISVGRQVLPHSFEERLALKYGLYQHFTRLWAGFHRGTGESRGDEGVGAIR